MRVTPEKVDGKEKVFEFLCAQSCSITGHGVTVFDTDKDNVLLNADALDGGTWLTIPREIVEELQSMIESDWGSLGDGRTEDFSNMTPYFALDAYGTYFYFAKGFQALRAYIRMGGELKNMTEEKREKVPKAMAVYALYRRCAILLLQNGIDRKYLSVLP